MVKLALLVSGQGPRVVVQASRDRAGRAARSQGEMTL